MSTETTIAKGVPVEALDLQRQTVCVQFSVGYPGQRRKVRSRDVAKDEIPAEQIHVSKSILECQELKDVISYANDTRVWLRNRTVPFADGIDGIYVMSNAIVVATDNEMIERQNKWEGMIEKFIAVLPEIIKRDEKRLGPLFNSMEYWSERRLRRMFYWTVRYLQLSTPESLREIDPEIWKREGEKAARDLAEVVENSKQLLLVEMQKLVDHMIDRLTPGADGKKKVFRDSMVENFGEFLKNADFRNLSGSEELATLVDVSRKLLSGVDPQTLRDVDATRDVVKEGFSNVKEILDQMVELAPDRQFDFDE